MCYCSAGVYSTLCLTFVKCCCNMVCHVCYLSLFQTSVYEIARLEDFPSMSLIVEDFMKDHGANYSGK